MPAIVKKLLVSLSLLLLLLFILFFWQVWQNNKNADAVTAADIQPHFDNAVSWLNTNYQHIEHIQNPILWWMINQASIATGDEALKNIYDTYKKEHIDSQPPNLSTPMFDQFYRPRVPDISVLRPLQDYQIFFFYALSCDDELASEPTIQKQMHPDFCSSHFLHPRCITHQMMGLRFMQRYQCGYDATVNATIEELQNTVITELTWDFRVVDAYIQRVLMLVDTGAYEKVKPIWIRNILQAQNVDGSWDDLHPLFHLGNNKVFGFTSMYPKLQNEDADFHTTAQAIWLLALLLEQTQQQQN
ncbi:MAG: hypothetical protein RQ982_09955 [Gammaproteobacteria bacterium]|nr:hypothetical protein [Gammaproteobacteria bacterium]